MKTSKEVQDYYNNYSKKQIKTGTNLRHFYLINMIIKAGLKKKHKVLEIGCGIGTLTGLLNNYLNKGKLVATDISNTSIEIAKKTIKNSELIEFITTDMSSFKYHEIFDFIILPDVLEHIPIEQHKNLFAVLNKHMHENSRIIINIPHPKIIEYLQVNEPEKLQVIDQALNADLLLNNIYSNELQLDSYKSYSLFHLEPDYAFIILKKNLPVIFSETPKYRIIYNKLIQRIIFSLSLI